MYLSLHWQEISGYRVKNNWGQTEEGGKKHWTVCKTQRRREREKGGDRVYGTSYLTQRLWRILCFCCCGGGSTSSWTVAKHVSSSVTPCLSPCPPLSLSDPPPTFPLTLLPEFCSDSQSDHLPQAPVREEEGNSNLSGLVVVVGVHRAPRFPLRQWNDQVQSSSTVSNTNATMSLFDSGQTPSKSTWLTGSSVTQQTPRLSRCLSPRLSAFPSDLSGHILPATLVCAFCPESRTFIGRGPFTRAETGGALLIYRSG